MHEMFDISGRTALVTGASSGLGDHFARFLAASGAKVTAVARRKERLDSLVTDINRTGGEATGAFCDVTDHNSILTAIETAEQVFGPLDILVNNAGATVAKPILEHGISDWTKVVDTNLTGTWVMAQEAAKRMVPRGRGSIINIASAFAIRTFATVPGYAASKAGVIHLTRAMAVELATSGIRVNAITPGFFDTELGEENRKRHPERRAKVINDNVPMQRVGEHEELDGPLLLLASDAGSYITGEILVVDGGLTVSPVQ